MKTSNKLILAALLLVILALIGYDLFLRAEYLSGRYKDPFSGYTALKFKNFDTVDLVSSTAANVKFVQGPFSVKIDPIALEYVRLTQNGTRLKINAVYETNFQYNPHPYILVVTCPKLASLNTNARYVANHKQVIDTAAREDWNMRKVLIDGFKQDNLSINQDYGSTVVLSNNHIVSIKAVTGTSPGSGSRTVILKGNRFKNAAFDIRNKSQLLLNDTVAHNLSYHLADSTKLILTGAAQYIFKK
jgi:hypothetical protein